MGKKNNRFVKMFLPVCWLPPLWLAVVRVLLPAVPLPPLRSPVKEQAKRKPLPLVLPRTPMWKIMKPTILPSGLKKNLV